MVGKQPPLYLSLAEKEARELWSGTWLRCGIQTAQGDKDTLNIFINYFRSDARSTCLNLSVARFILCAYGAWKIATYPYAQAAFFPDDFIDWNPRVILDWFRWPAPEWMIFEQTLAVVFLAMCGLGFARAWSAFGAALLITHMEGLTFAIDSEKTATNLAFFLIFYGIFRAPDKVSLDAYFASGRFSLGALKADLARKESSNPVRLEALKWFLVILAIIYFFTGFGKVEVTGWNLDWASWEHMRLILLNNSVERSVPVSPFGEFLAGEPLLLAIAGYGTLFLELGFVLVVLAGLPITPFLLGLGGMHIAILAAMNLNYLTDMLFLYTAFFAWDSLARRLQRGRALTVVYDDHCSFCIRVLLLLRSMDVNGGLRFIGASDPQAPEGHDYASAMVVFGRNGQVFRGYDGFTALLSYLGLTRPMAWLMAFPPVAAVGRLVYAWVARNRSCLSACRVKK